MDGSYRRPAWTAVPTPEGVLYAVARDITERGQPEEERAHSIARDQAVALAQKEELLTAVCHDLQQLLTLILAETQIMHRQLARGETLAADQLGPSASCKARGASAYPGTGASGQAGD